MLEGSYEEAMDQVRVTKTRRQKVKKKDGEGFVTDQSKEDLNVSDLGEDASNHVKMWSNDLDLAMVDT